MKENVTIVPSDKIIIVNGSALIFDFEAPENLHAIQWHDGVGEIEYTNGVNQSFDSDCYADDVAPFVILWETEKTRIETEQANAEAETLAQYNSTEARAERIRTERDRRITACDWVITRSLEQASLGGTASLTEDEYTAWITYRQALRDLPSLDGFPWDGGGEETPWPEEPDGEE